MKNKNENIKAIGTVTPWQPEWGTNVFVELCEAEDEKKTISKGYPNKDGVFVLLVDASCKVADNLFIQVLTQKKETLASLKLDFESLKETESLNIFIQSPKISRAISTNYHLVPEVITLNEKVQIAEYISQIYDISFSDIKIPLNIYKAISGLNNIYKIAILVLAGEEESIYQLRYFLEQNSSFEKGKTNMSTKGVGKNLTIRTNTINPLKGSGIEIPCWRNTGSLIEILNASFYIDILEGREDIFWVDSGIDFVKTNIKIYGNFRNSIVSHFQDSLNNPVPDFANEVSLFSKYELSIIKSGKFSKSYRENLPSLNFISNNREKKSSGLDLESRNIGDFLPKLSPFDDCEMLMDMCIAMFRSLTAAQANDSFVSLIDSVYPNCLCHDFDHTQIFIAKPKQNKYFPESFPTGVDLYFGGQKVEIWSHVKEEIRFRIPQNSKTGWVYLKRIGSSPSQVFQELSNSCGKISPLPTGIGFALNQSPKALISIIFPPTFYKFTADGESGNIISREACTPVKICWHSYLEDQNPRLKLHPCSSIKVTIRDRNNNIIANGDEKGCFTENLENDKTYFAEAISFAGTKECGKSQIISMTVARVKYIRLYSSISEIKGGNKGSIRIRISCPAPSIGLKVRLNTSNPNILQIPDEVTIRSGMREGVVEFTTLSACQSVEISASAIGHVTEKPINIFIYRQPNLRWTDVNPSVPACTSFNISVFADCLPNNLSDTNWELSGQDGKIIRLNVQSSNMNEQYDLILPSNRSSDLIHGLWKLKVLIPSRENITSNLLNLAVTFRSPVVGPFSVPRPSYEICAKESFLSVTWSVSHTRAIQLLVDEELRYSAGSSNSPLTSPCGSKRETTTISIDSAGSKLYSTKELVLKVQGFDNNWTTANRVKLMGTTINPNPIEKYIVRNLRPEKLHVYAIQNLNSGPIFGYKVAKAAKVDGSTTISVNTEIPLPECEPVFIIIFTDSVDSQWDKRKSWEPADRDWALRYSASQFVRALTRQQVTKVKFSGAASPGVLTVT